MSVFLRWGIFGILGVAALLYAYNASKRLAEVHAAKAAPAASATSAEDVDPPEEDTSSESQPPQENAAAKPAAAVQRLTPECEAELGVAQRAIDMRKEGAPLDRVLRMQEIAWQESPERRERLTAVATRWFNYAGDFSPEALRIAVGNACPAATPAS